MEQNQLIHKGKKGILKIIFGRTGIIIGLLAIQVLYLFAGLKFLASLFPYFWMFSVLFSLGVLIFLISNDDNPAFKLTWMLLMLVMPVFGILMYVYVKMEFGHRKMKKAVEHAKQVSQSFVHECADVPKEIKGITTYLNHQGFPAYQNTQAHYFPLGEVAFEEMLKQLKKAEKFIFLEYFIIADDYMWNSILELLKEKAAHGVEVRVLYDGTCAVSRLPYSYPKTLEKMGIKCKMFAPIRPFVSTHYNYRDHRKIMVIDGQVGFTGGINLTDEYINRIHPYGHWKDNAMILNGEAVYSLTLMFLQMWNTDGKENDDYQTYLKPVSMQGDGYMIPYGDSPLDYEQVGELVYIDIINQAKDYVYIMSPYLILDNEMITALTFAVKRGVDVKILMPHIPDAEIPFALAHTYYPQLLKNGVKIYEYEPGYLHAKVFVSDDCKAVVGTINLDYRSLYHHFECAVFHYQTSVVQEAKQDILNTLKQCIEINEEVLKQDTFVRKITGSLMRLIAPLM